MKHGKSRKPQNAYGTGTADYLTPSDRVRLFRIKTKHELVLIHHRTIHFVTVLRLTSRIIQKLPTSSRDNGFVLRKFMRSGKGTRVMCLGEANDRLLRRRSRMASGNQRLSLLRHQTKA